MSVISAVARYVRGARRIELFIGAALLAAAVLLLANGGGSSDARTPLEIRMEAALSCIEGAGDVRVMINENEDGRATGVLIVAQGAGDIRVQLEIRRAVAALTDADAARIEIVEME